MDNPALLHPGGLARNRVVIGNTVKRPSGDAAANGQLQGDKSGSANPGNFTNAQQPREDHGHVIEVAPDEQPVPAMHKSPVRLVFIDETSVKTNLARLRGRALRGQRLAGSAPFGSWNAQTFIAGLSQDMLLNGWRTFENNARVRMIKRACIHGTITQFDGAMQRSGAATGIFPPWWASVRRKWLLSFGGEAARSWQARLMTLSCN